MYGQLDQKNQEMYDKLMVAGVNPVVVHKLFDFLLSIGIEPVSVADRFIYLDNDLQPAKTVEEILFDIAKNAGYGEDAFFEKLSGIKRKRPKKGGSLRDEIKYETIHRMEEQNLSDSQRADRIVKKYPREKFLYTLDQRELEALYRGFVKPIKLIDCEYTILVTSESKIVKNPERIRVEFLALVVKYKEWLQSDKGLQAQQQLQEWLDGWKSSVQEELKIIDDFMKSNETDEPNNMLRMSKQLRDRLVTFYYGKAQRDKMVILAPGLEILKMIS